MEAGIKLRVHRESCQQPPWPVVPNRKSNRDIDKSHIDNDIEVSPSRARGPTAGRPPSDKSHMDKSDIDNHIEVSPRWRPDSRQALAGQQLFWPKQNP